MMKILASIDFSEVTDAVIAQINQLAPKLKAHVWLMHVAEPDPEFVGHDIDPPVMRDQLAKHFHAEHKELQQLAERLRKNGIDSTALLIQGATAETIIHQADKLQADLLIVGNNKHGLIHNMILGSDSKSLIKQSTIPILLVPVPKI